jgi:hypothetical protein
MADDQEQPVAEDQKESKSRMSFFPKLLLWALVIAFGYLYIGSLERDQGEGDAPATAGQASPPAAPAQPAVDAEPAPTASAETASSGSAAATGSTAGAAWPAQPQRAAPAAPAEPQTAQQPQPQPAAPAAPAEPQAAQQPTDDAAATGEREVSKTEAEAFAHALMDKEGAAQTSKPTAPESQPEPPDQPKASGAAPAAQTSATQSPTLPLPPPQQAGAATAPAQPEVSTPTGDDTAAAGAEPGPGQVMPPPPLTSRDRVYQRARIAAQYRELRRQAIEDARRRWYESHPMPGRIPVPGFYGTPGYPAPGYPAADPSQGQTSQ